MLEASPLEDVTTAIRRGKVPESRRAEQKQVARGSGVLRRRSISKPAGDAREVHAAFATRCF